MRQWSSHSECQTLLTNNHNPTIQHPLGCGFNIRASVFHDRSLAGASGWCAKTQRAMVLGQVVQLVVIQIASQPYRRQHQDAPVTQSLASPIGSRLGRDIAFDQLQDRLADLGRRVDLLSGSQNRDQLIPTIEIQHHLRHTVAVQPPLPLNRVAHPFAPRR